METEAVESANPPASAGLKGMKTSSKKLLNPYPGMRNDELMAHFL
jgi:hypothetical protein